MAAFERINKIIQLMVTASIAAHVKLAFYRPIARVSAKGSPLEAGYVIAQEIPTL